MLLDPSSFPYFLVLFTISIVGGTYLLYAYYRDRLLIINAIILYLTGARVASEYYIQTLETFAEVEAYAPWHILPANIFFPLQWIMVVYYIQPFRGLRHAQILHWALAFGFMALPFIGHNYFCTIDPQLYVYAPERIEGYWRYMVAVDFWYYSVYTIHTQVSLVMINVMLLIGIIRTPRKRLRQIILLVSYSVIPILYFAVARRDGWIVPNVSLMFIGHAVVISWYVSNYRMFRSNYNLITESLYGSIADLAIATDQEERITHVNPAAKTFFGANPKHLKSELGRIRQEYSDGAEMVIKNQAGQERTVRYRTAPIQGGDRLIGYTNVFTDLTEIRNQEEKLRQLNATKDRLFAIIGHDLRRPALAFRGIGAKIKYLTNKNDTQRLRQLGGNLEREALTLSNLLDNLLNWALQQRQMLPYSPEPVDLQQLVENLAIDYDVLLAAKQITLANKVPAGFLLVVDRNTLQTILRNLLDNGSKFSPVDATIEVEAFTRESGNTVSVTNSGVTLNETEIRNIKQGITPAGRQKTGAKKSLHGFGLHLVQELLNLHGGELNITSQPEKGVTVAVTFPHPEPASELAASAKE